VTVLDELLRLKVYRESKAEVTLAKCRHVLIDVTRRADEAREALHGYQRWSNEQERSLYDALYGQLVRLRDLERLREDVVMLRMKERALNEGLAKTEAERVQADTATREARAVHELATRTREKFIQLVHAQAEEIRLEDERKEDAEVEDLYAIQRDREDWEVRDDE
jgi:hypothetical protein